MNREQLYLLDAMTRADAKNAREARRMQFYASEKVHTHTKSEAAAARAMLQRKTTPLMAYVRSLLPENISNAELCRRLQLSDSTRRRLEKGDSSPDEKTLQHLIDVLQLDARGEAALRKAAHRTHTRFGAVLLCCCAFAVYDPVYVNAMLRKYLADEPPLYSPQDVSDYDAFESDFLDWRIMCRRRTPPSSEADAKIKASFDACSKEFSHKTPLLDHISLLLQPTPMRPGHLLSRSTLPKSTRDNLNDEKSIPSEKTLWKICMGLELNKRGAEDLFIVARRDAERILKKREAQRHE